MRRLDVAARVLHHLRDAQHFNHSVATNMTGSVNSPTLLMSPSSVTGAYNITALSTPSPSVASKPHQSPGTLWGVVIIALTLVLVLSGIASCCTRIFRWRRSRQQELERDLKGARRKDERMPGRLTTWGILEPTVAPQKSVHGPNTLPMQPRPVQVFLEPPVKADPSSQLSATQPQPDDATIVEVTIAPQHDSPPAGLYDPIPAQQLTAENAGNPNDGAITLPIAPATTDDENLCPICLEGYEHTDPVRVLPCTHYFHSECVDTWIDTQAMVCPLCRTDLRLLQAASKSDAVSATWADRLFLRRWFSSPPAAPRHVDAASSQAAGAAGAQQPAGSLSVQQPAGAVSIQLPASVASVQQPAAASNAEQSMA